MFKDVAFNYPTDKFNQHTYLLLYNELFSDKKDQIKNVLEIGVQNGGSMQLWHDYFTNANIYGIDINTLPSTFVKTNRMFHYIENAYTTNFIQKNFSNKINFDIAIDDGPHSLESMMFFAKYYSSIIAPKGLMIIEDIPSIDWFSQIIHSFPEHLQSKTRIVDNRYINNRWDDMLVVLYNL